jgi:hypothetical protein
MAQALYAASSGATPFTSLTAAQTAIAVVNAGTDFGLQIKKYRIAFNGVTAANPPVTVRFFTTANSTAGTSSAATIQQVAGRVIATTNLTAAFNYTAEPTTKTYTQDEFLLTPNGGTVIYDFPLGDEPDTAIGAATFGIEITASVAVGTSVALWFTRI